MTIQNGPKKENLEAEVIEDQVAEDVMVEDEAMEKSDVNSTEKKLRISKASPLVLFHKKILMQHGCI